MTNQEILQCALKQSAIDLHCAPEDFLAAENKIVVSEKNEGARRDTAFFLSVGVLWKQRGGVY